LPRQPGQPHYQPPKSMVFNFSRLIKFRYRDSSWCQDTVYWAAGLCAAGTSFCRAIWQFYRDPKLCAVNRDSSIYWDYPIWQLYRDPKLSAVNRDYSIWQLYRDPKLSAICRDFYLDQKLTSVYRDFAKTHASACRCRQLIKPPGRYSAFEAHD
jgi:hypothetical protein